jgi:hypothetical protein
MPPRPRGQHLGVVGQIASAKAKAKAKAKANARQPRVPAPRPRGYYVIRQSFDRYGGHAVETWRGTVGDAINGLFPGQVAARQFAHLWYTLDKRYHDNLGPAHAHHGGVRFAYWVCVLAIVGPSPHRQLWVV